MKKKKLRPWGFDDIMVIAAFRYCLGRMTYIVGCCTEWIKEQWPNFNNKTKILIERELREEINRDNQARIRLDQFKPLGHDCDRQEWLELLRFIEDAEKKEGS